MKGQRRVRLLGIVTGVVLTLALVVVVPVVSQRWGVHPSDAAPAAVPASWQRPAVSAKGLALRSGVQISQLALTGQGGLLDLRYQVLDPDKAVALHDESTPPALVDETNGLVISQLFMDHFHTGPFKAGVTYYLVFSNPGNQVHRGSRVSVLLGNAQVAHVVVR